MEKTPFEHFIVLVQNDQKINTLAVSIQNLEKQNTEYNKTDSSNTLAVEKVKSKLEQMRQEVNARELEMKILDTQEAEKKQRIDHVANHREYQSLKAEIDVLKLAQHNLEDILMGAWNHLENAKKEFDAANLEYDQKHAQLQEQITNNQEKITLINQEITQLKQISKEQEKTVPTDWLEKYQHMRSRVSNPVVPVINGDCSACFYQVSAQDMQFLKHRKLVQCKDCFRLLYLPEAQEALSKQQDS